MNEATPAKQRSFLIAILLALGVTVVAYAWLDHVNPEFMITEDGIRDLLLARDCTDLGHCHLIGPRTSVTEFHQGSVWLDLLVGIRLLGGDTSTARTVVLLLLALSAGTLCVVLWRWVRPPIALPASVLLIAALGVSRDASQLVNSSVSGFPDLLTAAGLLCFGLSGQRRFLIFSAFALGVAINMHVGSLSLLPALVMIAALASPQPWRACLLVVGILVLTLFITSRAALLANVVGLVRQERVVPSLVAGFAIALVSTALASRFRALSSDARAWIIGLLLVAPLGVAALWLIFLRQHHFAFRYLHPILGPATALGAAILWLPFEMGARRFIALRWVPTAAAVAAVALVASRVERPLPTGLATDRWTISEAAAIADVATKRGWTYEDLVFRLQSFACSDLLAGISVWAPPPGPLASAGGSQVQVVKVRRDAVPALAGAHDVVPLEGDAVAVLRQVDSWLQPEKLVACRRPPDSLRAPLCSVAARPSQERRGAQEFLFASRSNPGIHSLDLPAPYTASYEIPLSPRAGESRDLTLTEHLPSECSWRITRVEGVSVEGQLPARRVRLHSDDGSAGLIVIEKPMSPTACPDSGDNRYPPCVFEAPPEDPLGALVEAG